MEAHELHCCQRVNQRRGWAAGGALFTGLAVLMPKCPVCFAAWLGALGLSGVAARVDPRALWLVAALAAAVAGAWLARRIPTRRRQS